MGMTYNVMMVVWDINEKMMAECWHILVVKQIEDG